MSIRAIIQAEGAGERWEQSATHSPGCWQQYWGLW